MISFHIHIESSRCMGLFVHHIPVEHINEIHKRCTLSTGCFIISSEYTGFDFVPVCYVIKFYRSGTPKDIVCRSSVFREILRERCRMQAVKIFFVVATKNQQQLRLRQLNWKSIPFVDAKKRILIERNSY